MKVDDLKLFLKVVELGSFTAAANALDLPRANVSRRIGELEQSLGTPLFHRTTRSLSLTTSGEGYVENLQKAVDLLDFANEQVSNKNNEVRGKIKIGLLPETYELVQPILFNFQDKYPHVELDIRNINNGFTDMFKQGLDIAFHGGELFDSDLVARKLLMLDKCIVASPNYLKTFGEPKTVQELKDHHIVCSRWPSGEVDNVWQFQEESVELHPKLISNNIGFVKNATVLDRGISFVPKLLIRKELESGALVQILTELTLTQEPGWLLYPQPKTLSQASRLLIKKLIEEIPKLV
ncbi:LysR family transcriptional regulator [Vibrio hepatarius]|uniref:LysR family transcriptional regulator n=1 Tax=Vibrio hepatarius TaxID=171383 RepID=UPI00142DE40C|nr:LysR family transcriptional regulator [Vibrio hepatarius]NIY81577.1 LysR family transcriptional regulator [Vibrio hepatarius]NVJ55769.1 LysR family transcriptional regulator [Vibrionaceae bacterium]